MSHTHIKMRDEWWTLYLGRVQRFKLQWNPISEDFVFVNITVLTFMNTIKVVMVENLKSRVIFSMLVLQLNHLDPWQRRKRLQKPIEASPEFFLATVSVEVPSIRSTAQEILKTVTRAFLTQWISLWPGSSLVPSKVLLRAILLTCS